MGDTLKPDILVIGAGSGGLSVAAGAAQMGAKVVLVEKDRMGGDCLNTGCVPSKALLAAGHVAHTFRTSGRFGIAAAEPQVDFAKVNAHIHDVIAGIAPHDSVERFEGLGVTVIKDRARFVDPQTIEAGGKRIVAKRIVIATGSRAAVPPIDGLDAVPYLTNETIFEQTERPAHLIIVGGGPIGIEMAQAHRRLGAEVTVLERDKILPKDEPEAVAIVRARLHEEGIDLRENVDIVSVGKTETGVHAEIARDGRQDRIDGSHILIAAGRKANVDTLDLEKAGIDFDARGIKVDDRLRSTNKRIYAIGDVAGGYQFTHIAGYHAGIVIRNILFRVPAKVSYKAIPWVTYTDPELAHAGLTEADARKALRGVKTVEWEFGENDRARAERETDGLVKIVLDRKGRVVGATIVGAHAGELIGTWVLAIEQGIKLSALAGTIAPYPTLSEVSKRAAGAYFTPTLYSGKVRALVRALLMLP